MKDYSKHAFWLAFFVICILLAAGQIPQLNIAGIELKHINIISDLYKFEPSDQKAELVAKIDEQIEPEEESEEPKESIIIEKNARKQKKNNDSSILGGGNIISSTENLLKPKANPEFIGNSADTVPVVRIENYSDTYEVLEAFFDKLNNINEINRPIRVAVIGDSFIEGDILTADMREYLQDIFNGSGVGFVPVTSNVSQFRQTVIHNFSSWKTLSLLERKNVDSLYKNKFFVSGNFSLSGKGSTIEYKGSSFRKHLSSFSTARILYLANDPSEVEVFINGSEGIKYPLEGSSQVEQLIIKPETGKINNISFRFDDENEVLVYGVFLDDDSGIAVDNYSLRGNSGISLSGINGNICRQINNLVAYDLIILQYGANVISSEIKNYGYYTKAMSTIVERLKRFFPETSILIMGMPDRSTRIDGEFATIPTIPALIEAQRDVAKNCGVAFWDTFSAMGGHNSMVAFVERNWAGKDYTHIGSAGGKYLGRKFAQTLVYEFKQYNYRQLHGNDSAN